MVDSNEKQVKSQRLEWAIANASLNQFKFYRKGRDHHAVESADFVRAALFAFRAGNGYYINDRSYVCSTYGSGQTLIEEGEMQFRAALVRQIHELTGETPRVAIENCGYAIYYS